MGKTASKAGYQISNLLQISNLREVAIKGLHYFVIASPDEIGAKQFPSVPYPSGLCGAVSHLYLYLIRTIFLVCTKSPAFNL